MGMDRVVEKKNNVKRKYIIYSAGVLGILILFAVLFEFISSKRISIDRDKLTIAEVSYGEFKEYVSVKATIEPFRTFYLDAVEGGRVDKLFIDAGNNVNFGDPILKLENTNLLLDVMYREAELVQQSNNLRNTKLNYEQNRLSLKNELAEINYKLDDLQSRYDRNKQLREKEFVSKEFFETMEKELRYWKSKQEINLETQKLESTLRVDQIKQLEVQLKRMNDNMAIVKEKLENLTIKAPISGQLTSLNAEIGQTKTVGERLGQIDVIDSFKITSLIDEYWISNISPGIKGSVEIDGEKFDVIVKKVYPEVKNGSFKTEFNFTNIKPSKIRRGQTVFINISLSESKNALLLKKGSFFQTTGGQWVYILNKSNNEATKRIVNLGRQNPNYYEILKGLYPGDKVIISDYSNYNENDVIKIK